MNDWLVFDIDEGLMARARTRREALNKVLGAPVLSRFKYGEGSYEYTSGFKGEETHDNFFVVHGEERARQDGWGWALDRGIPEWRR